MLEIFFLIAKFFGKINFLCSLSNKIGKSILENSRVRIFVRFPLPQRCWQSMKYDHMKTYNLGVNGLSLREMPQDSVRRSWTFSVPTTDPCCSSRSQARHVGLPPLLHFFSTSLKSGADAKKQFLQSNKIFSKKHSEIQNIFYLKISLNKFT